MKISRKLIFAFTCIALLGTLVGYVSIESSRKALCESIGKESSSFADKILEQIERQVYNRIELLQTHTQYMASEKQLVESNQRFDKMDNVHEYISKRDSEWISVSEETILPYMQGIIQNELSSMIRDKIELKEFYKAKYGYPVFAEIFVTNKYGANVAQTHKTSDYYQADEEWWQSAKRDGLYVADIAFDQSAHVYSVDIGIRLDDETGNFSGVLKAVVNIEELVNIVKEADNLAEYKNTNFKLLTEDGRIIYSTEDYEFLENWSQVFFSRIIEREHQLLHDKMHRIHNSYFIATGDNKSRKHEELFAHAHSKGYKDYKGSSWILIVELETDEIFAPVVRLRNHLLVISLSITAFAVCLGLIISRSISKPILKLTQAAEIMSRKDLDHRVDIKSKGEVGILASSFNHMADKLRDSHHYLEDKIRQRTTELEEILDEATQRASMAETTTDVLHNVKNVLNSITVASSIIAEAVSRSEISNLQKVAEIIKKHDKDLGTFLTEDQKGKHIPTFLIELSKTLADEQASTTDKLHSLTENIEHIKGIINMQQSYAKISGTEVSIHIKELIDNALSINKVSLERHGIELVCDFDDDIGIVNINSQKVLQILVNLIRNAKQALVDNENGNKVLTIRTHKQEDDKIRIEVTDNGEGISQENFTKLFTHGFTTKEDGHGFGLHGGSLIAKELGGLLTASSNGEGKGATFILDLPFKPVKATQ
jgi:signal transduction histidine kinase